jgi:hypothetical protein
MTFYVLISLNTTIYFNNWNYTKLLQHSTSQIQNNEVNGSTTTQKIVKILHYYYNNFYIILVEQFQISYKSLQLSNLFIY